MDISYWTQLNPTVKVTYTKRLFHDFYAHRLKIYIPAGRLLRDTNLTRLREEQHYADRIAFLIKRANEWAGKTYYYGINKDSSLKNADAKQLNNTRLLMTELEPSVRVRIEEPHAIFYSNDIEKLKRFAQVSADRIVEITTPKNQEHHQILLDGNEIKNPKNVYKYKLVLNRMWDPSDYARESQDAIKSILENAGTDVRTTDSVIKNLSRAYFSGGYIYTNDDRLAFLMNIARPGFVKKIYNLVDLTDK